MMIMTDMNFLGVDKERRDQMSSEDVISTVRERDAAAHRRLSRTVKKRG